jgi:hypothetical protein
VVVVAGEAVTAVDTAVAAVEVDTAVVVAAAEIVAVVVVAVTADATGRFLPFSSSSRTFYGNN